MRGVQARCATAKRIKFLVGPFLAACYDEVPLASMRLSGIKRLSNFRRWPTFWARKISQQKPSRHLLVCPTALIVLRNYRRLQCDPLAHWNHLARNFTCDARAG